MIFVTLLFFGLVLGLAVLPLLPAILEWIRPTDTSPLQVVQASEVDIRHLANGFRNRVTRELAEPLSAVRLTGLPRRGEYRGAPYLVLPDGAPLFPPGTAAAEFPIEPLLASPGDLHLPEGTVLTREAYAEGSVSGGAGSVCRAILAQGDIRLGPAAHTLRWVHADGTVQLDQGCRCHGRASAGTEIVLDPECGFERLHAPRIRFGPAPEDPTGSGPELPLLEPSGVRGGRVIEQDAGRWLIRGDAEIPAQVRVESSLVVMGRCVVRQGTLVLGGIKAHKDLELEAGVEVRGSVVGERRLVIGPHCRIEGPVVAEAGARFASGTVIGAPDRLTTVSGLDLDVAPGVTAHGTVWAHRSGRVGAGGAGAPAGAPAFAEAAP